MNKNPFLFLIGGIFSLMIAMGIGRFAYTPILPIMQDDLSFTDAVAGYLASSNYAGYFVGAMFTGILSLKRNRTLYLRASLIVSIATTFMMGFTHSYTLMFFIRFISGMSSAFIFVLASSIVLDNLANLGKINWAGYYYSGVGLGIFFSTLFIPSLNDLYQWEGVWKGLAIISVILAIFVWFSLKDSPNLKMKKDSQIVTLKLPPYKWITWLIIAYGLEGLGYIVTGTFIVSIAEKNSIFNINSSFVWLMVGLAAIPSCVVWINLVKYWGFVKSLVISMTLQSIGIVLPVFWLSPASLIISALLFGATFMGIATLATTLARQMSPANSSRIIGYLTAVYAIGQMIGPTIAGILSSYTLSFNSALIGAASAVFIGAMLLVNGVRFEKVSKIGTKLQN